MWFHLSWTEVVDNLTTSVCCEQLSLKTQPVLSIMYTNLWTCLIQVQKAKIRCFRIDLCIRNFDIRLTDLYDFIIREQKSLTTLRLLSAVNSCRWKLNWFCPSCTNTLNLSRACSERTRLLGLRYIRVSRIYIVIRLTDFYDFICREQKSLTT